MVEEIKPQSEAQGQLEVTQDPETLSLQDDIRNGLWFERKWWGFHLHFNHACIQALIQLGGNNIISLIADIVSELLPTPLGEVAGTIIQIRWEVMKLLDQQSADGVKLTSPWIAWGMFIPSKRGSAPRTDLWWLVYGNPQESIVYSEGGKSYVFANPKEVYSYDAAGGVWGDSEKFPGHKSSAGASLAVYKGELYCVHRGDADEHLWYTVFDGEKSWQEDIRFPNHRSAGNPALAVYKDRLYCVHRGAGNDGHLWYTSFNGTSWSEDCRIEAMSATGPALAVYNNRLYCVHRGHGSNQNVWYLSFDGVSWSEDSQTSAWSGDSPALAVYNNRLYCVHRGHQSDASLWYTHFNGASWSNDQRLAAMSSFGPALAVYKNHLYCVHRGNADANLWYTHFNGTSWSNDQRLSPWTSGRPGLAVYHDKHTSTPQLFCVHRGA